jgi:hypothetical protein
MRAASRADMRRMLIEGGRAAMRASQAGLRAQIEALGLRIAGGELAPVLVVEGPAAALARAVRLVGVAHAQLDGEFRTIER